MKRHSAIFFTGLLAVVISACTSSSGGLGPVPSPVAVASDQPGGTDVTPAPSSRPESTATPAATPDESAPTRPSAAPGSTAAPAPADTTIVRAYFVVGGEPGTEGLVPVLHEVPRTTAVATAAMRSLLAGPAPIEGESFGPATAIPEGTRLLGLTVKNGTATVDLSTEYDSGSGTASMQYRLAQVVYTLTQFSTIKSVVFQIEGETVTVFSGEGIVLDGPQVRADYAAQLPSIFVDRPAYGAAIGNPGRVAGSANVFEATFRIAVIDGAGRTVVDQQVMAKCGTGCRGAFDVSLPYTVTKAQWGTLRAYDLSAKDGSPQDVREYPVWLAPAS